MGTEEIVNYVISTPGNTNPNVLRGMVEEVAGSGLPPVTPEDVGKTAVVSDDGKWIASGVPYTQITVFFNGNAIVEDIGK